MTLLTSNPLYHATIALAALAVYASGRSSRAFDVFLVVGLLFATLTVPLNLATGSSGPTELLTLPSLQLPGWLGSVQLGGDITGESLLFTIDSALALMAVVCIAAAFNASVDHGQLIKMTPPAFAQLGVIVTVALVIIPEMISSVTAINEARAVRGHRMTVRALPALFVAVLGDALERSVQRAESLEARGFGALADPPRAREWAAAAAALATCAVCAFAWYYYPDWRWLFAGAGIAAVAAMLLVIRRLGARHGATRLWQPSLGAADWVLMSTAAAGFVVFWAMRAGGWGAINYVPFPAVAVPPYHALAAAACAALLAPVVYALAARRPA